MKTRFNKAEKQMQKLWRHVIDSVNSMARGTSYAERQQKNNTEIRQKLERLSELERTNSN